MQPQALTPEKIPDRNDHDIERVYDLSEKMVTSYDNLDMLLHTYINGELKEISVYNEYDNDFNLVSRFENE